MIRFITIYILQKSLSREDMFKFSYIVQIQGQSECVTEKKLFLMEKKWLKIQMTEENRVCIS